MKPPISLLLDTDMLTDCDDAAALALAFTLERLGHCHLLGVTVSSAHPQSAAVVSAIADHYQRSDLPIGAPSPGEGYTTDTSCFLGPVSAEFPHRIESNASAENAVHLMRRLLLEAPNDSVTLVTIGYHSNLRSLLQSQADDLSPIPGNILVQYKVRHWICMGGNFPHDTAEDNVNFTRDLPAALYSLRNFPKPIVFAGREIGHNVFVGDRFHDWPTHHPVRRAYELHRGRYGTNWDHHTADPCALLYAVQGPSSPFSLEYGSLILQNSGAFDWLPSSVSTSMARLLFKEAPASVAHLLNSLLTPYCCQCPNMSVLPT